MRIKLTIEHLPHQKLPINYQYQISSWIYAVLYASDNDFATWVHEYGYELDGKKDYLHSFGTKILKDILPMDVDTNTVQLRLKKFNIFILI